jgi:ribosomal protein L11 methyltransferase
VLDVGTGSGILGITALKLGAKHVFGTDLDENAITAVGENLASNDISSDRFHVLQGNIIDDKSVQDWAGYEKYDIVVANILADVIAIYKKTYNAVEPDNKLKPIWCSNSTKPITDMRNLC